MAEHHEHKPNGAGYEVEDASVREVIFTGIGLAVGTIIVCFAVFGLVKVLAARDAAGRTAMTQIVTQPAFPPEPRLQQKPWEELQVIRKREDDALTTYGWTDKDKGRVRIPIDQAIKAAVGRGFPVRPEGGTQGGSGMPKTGNPEGNVPSQATGASQKTPGAKANAPR